MTKQTSDPLDVNARLYRQVARLLDDMEAADRDDRMTMPQRISALIAVGRIQIMFANLRKHLHDGSAGSEVRKYAAAFARPNAVGGGKGGSRSASVVAFDSDDDGDAA
jgi:hypothetical protein